MKLSIIIPAYNEAGTIGKVLSKIFSANPHLDMEVIVVDDGSVDSTESEVKKLHYPVVYLRQEKNSGKGTAIRRGLEGVHGDFVLIQDADLEYDPVDYPVLLKPIFSEGAEVVYGSRILKKDNSHSYIFFYFGGRLLSWWTNFLYGAHITDEPTGYKVFKTSLLKSVGLTCRGFEFCPEVTAKLLNRGISIVEVPISYSPRSFREGKKICWKDGLIALWVLCKLRFLKDDKV